MDGTLSLVSCAILCGLGKLFVMFDCLCVIWVFDLLWFRHLICCDFGFTFDDCFGFCLATLH